MTPGTPITTTPPVTSPASTIKCIIVEDEVLAQDVIKTHLQRFDRFELAGIYRTAPEAGKALQSREIDLMFLDIRLPGMTGLNFLRTLENPPLVILTTAYAEYALESYEFSVIDYLLKPISFERFSKAVNKIKDNRLFSQVSMSQSGSAQAGFSQAGSAPDAPARDHIFIKSNSKFFKVSFPEILLISGMKDYLKIHTPEYTLVTHQTMNEMEKLLPGSQFIRVHRSYIIPLANIKSIQNNSIELKASAGPGGPGSHAVFPGHSPLTTGRPAAPTAIPIGISYRESVSRTLFS